MIKNEANAQSAQAVADITANLIHDINTPLSCIQMQAKMLEKYLPVMLVAYDKIQEQHLGVADISEEHRQELSRCAQQIKLFAEQASDTVKDYWLKIETKLGGGVEATEDLAQARMPIADVSTKKLRILIAEDDVIHQKIARKLLSEHYQITIVDNGRQALASCQVQDYDVVLMDFQMPELNGPETVQKMLQILTKPPLIFGLSNKPLGLEKQRFIGQGFNGFLEKPLSLGALERLLNAH
ncbi:MAG: response regulator [Cellvibrionaceae bacterium]|nr:response regulator [Cellvibrionaceae bacterium]